MTKITVKINTQSILYKTKRVIDSDVKKFAHMSFYKHMKDYVPAKTTMLYRQVEITDKSIRFFAPYARFQYFGKLMVSPVTGSSWAARGEIKTLTDINLKHSKEVHPLATSLWGEEAWKAKEDVVAREVMLYLKSRRGKNAK